jgi:hypothetical protein
MAITIPKYIQSANIQSATIDYEWDDWATIPALQKDDETLREQLSKLSDRAVLAFMCGSAEWLYFRLAPFCNDLAPAEYIEGAWAMIIDVRYCGYGKGTWWESYSRKKWNGPIQGPIEQGLLRLECAIQELFWRDNDPVWRADRLYALTSYVMPNIGPYQEWCTQVMSRFEKFYLKDPNDMLGDVVPREAVDLDFNFQPEHTESLMNQYLNRLDWKSNIFLSSPEGMLQVFDDDDGDNVFQGQPYEFRMEDDRRRRMNARAADEQDGEISDNG